MISKDEVDNIIKTYHVENDVGEMMGLLEHVGSPQVILELGVCFGGTLKIWEKVLPEDGVVIGVDIHPEVESRLTGQDWVVEECFVMNEVPVLRLQSSKEVYVVMSDSKSPFAAEAVKYLLGERKIDFFFHDGCHYGVGPVYDYANYEDLIRTGALVCIADTSDPRTQVDNLGTAALWRAFPEPKIPLVKNHAQGMSLWTKTEDFRINAAEIIEKENLEGDDTWNHLPVDERPDGL